MVEMNPHQAYKASFLEIYASIIRNRRLVFQMAKREVLGRYRGSIVGLAWSFFNPLLMLVVYTYFFSVVFKSRWGGAEQVSHADFAVVLFVGLIIHGLFSECINRAPMLIISNVNYVKRVVFPLEMFPLIALSSALFHTAISVAVLLLLQLFLTGDLHLSAALFPLVIVPFILFTLGIAWFLAAIGVFVRDISQATGTITSVLMFMSPVFYPISALPKSMQPIIMMNPLTLIIEESRKVLLFGDMPNWLGLGTYTLVSMAVAWVGFWWFQKTRKGFADVL